MYPITIPYNMKTGCSVYIDLSQFDNMCFFIFSIWLQLADIFFNTFRLYMIQYEWFVMQYFVSNARFKLVKLGRKRRRYASIV